MIESGIALAVIMGISEAVKRTTGVNAKFIPLLNLAFGLLFFIIWGELDFKADVLNGIILGLTASGLFSGAKNVVEGIKGV